LDALTREGEKTIIIAGGGFLGSELAWALARRRTYSYYYYTRCDFRISLIFALNTISERETHPNLPGEWDDGYNLPSVPQRLRH
jgi:NADH dehydrogenase FAD-containing subunit